MAKQKGPHRHDASRTRPRQVYPPKHRGFGGDFVRGMHGSVAGQIQGVRGGLTTAGVATPSHTPRNEKTTAEG